ncbi:MAG: inner membrane protein CreD, partial [Bacteroidota bacterium]
YIYIIIQLEKTALLAGSVGLFIIVALTMYVTRKIKWSEGEEIQS